jgi:hypothetical protein
VQRTVRHRWSPEDRAAQRYRYVPFEVPAGTPDVRVTLDYDRSRGVVDLGCFDAEGFRGYSGGARDEFTVTETAATPGYLPGPAAGAADPGLEAVDASGALPAGTWAVLLGLHRVPPGGLDTIVGVEIGGGAVPAPLRPPPPPGPRPAPRRLPAHRGRRWLAGDLHSHSVHSDGALTLDELADLARRRGLDYLAVTDHNTVSHHAHLADTGARTGVRLIGGQEVTKDEGHANCLGSVPWVDFRRPPDSWLADAEAAGALLSVNHPLAGDCRWRLPLERRPPLAEVWHTSWDRRDPAPLDWWASWGGIGVGGGDLHDPAVHDRLGYPTTWVEATDGDVLGALAAGRVAISCAPRGPVVLRRDDALVAVDAEGAVLVDAHGRRRPVRAPEEVLRGGEGPYRLIDGMGLTLALTA